jgi:1,2-diacylglycerol 3-alpha-glucosyltransferase
LSNLLRTMKPELRNRGLAVIWIDWYPYHVARFRGLQSAPGMADDVVGLELVGGVGVHAGLKFRESIPEDLPVLTLMPESDWRSAGQWSLAGKLWRALTSLDPRTVLVPGYYTLPALAAALWAKLHGRQSVLMTESTAGDHVRSAWKEILKSWLIRGLFDWAVTGGRAHRRYLQQLSFPKDRVVGCYDVVDNAYFESHVHELRKQPPLNAALSRGYFLYVGRLSSEKNVDGLLNAWIAYRAGGGTWALVLVGAGPGAEQLRRAASHCAFGADVHFAGHRDSRALPGYYAHATCFVLPSTREPWGLVVNEALASGLPVIVSNRCGCTEDLVEEGANGFVFDPTQPDQLTSALSRMESFTDEQRTLLGLRSMQIIQRFSPARFGEEISRIHRRSEAFQESASRDCASES